MGQDELHERGQALEDLFFKNVDAKLMEKLRNEHKLKEERAALGAALGISDPAVIDALLAHRLNAQAASALALVPLVAVAWADNVLEDRERGAIERACAEEKIEAGSAQFALIQQWLRERPPGDLLATWKNYVRAMRAHLDAAAAHQMKNAIVGRARIVAESAGGFLGMGNKISAAEQQVLDSLASAFD